MDDKRIKRRSSYKDPLTKQEFKKMGMLPIFLRLS